jgi:hypothetical protein
MTLSDLRISAAEARAIAQEAYVYGFPISSVPTSSAEFRLS